MKMQDIGDLMPLQIGKKTVHSSVYVHTRRIQQKGEFMVKKKNRLKIILISGILFILVSVCLCIDSSNASPYKHIALDVSAGMTVKQRKDDFKDICRFIEKNIPFIDEYEELYGISFKDIKKYYSEVVENTSSDFEYYAAVDSFLNNIPSGHMGIGFPKADDVPLLYTFRTNDYPDFGNACLYWEEQIRKENQKYYDVNVEYCMFTYVDGEYLSDKGDTIVNDVDYSSAKLLSVDDVPVDEFIKLCPLKYKLRYDHINDKPCRDYVILNDTCGIECTAEIQLADGTIVNENLYYGTKGVLAFEYKSYYKNENSETDVQKEKKCEQAIDYTAKEIQNSDIYAYNCSEKNFIYIMFNDFGSGGQACIDLLKAAEIPDNIIVDLRYNTGGYDSVSDSILEQMLDMTIKNEEKIYCAQYSSKGKLKYISNKFLYEENINKEVTGKSNKKHNIYVLVSGTTLSAADNFTAFIKNNSLGTVIGENNTGGEAHGSPDLKLMEQSGLYFYYTDIKWNNHNGTDNSVYGTAPDIYIPYDKQAREICYDISAKGEAVYTYENRLKWDNVLIETLKIIKEKEMTEE